MSCSPPTKSEIREIDTAAAESCAAGPGPSSSTSASPTSTSRAPSPGLGPHPPGHPREPGREPTSPTSPHRWSSTAPAAPAPPSPPRRSASSATRTSSRWPAGSTSGRTRAATGTTPSVLTPEQRNRYQRHLLLPEVGVEGQQKLLGRPGAAARRRRPRLAGRAVPGGGGCRHPRHRRHGRGRRVQPAAPDPPQHGPHRRAQGRLGQEDPDRHQPRRGRRHLRRAPRGRQRHRPPAPATTSSSTGPTTSRPLPAQRRLAQARASRSCTARSSASRARPRCSSPSTAPATAACSPSRRRRSWRPPAPRPACWACCPASSARSRRSRPSSSSSASATTCRGRLLAYDSLEQSFRTFKVNRDPSARRARSTRPDRHRRVRRVLHAPSGRAPARRLTAGVRDGVWRGGAIPSGRALSLDEAETLATFIRKARKSVLSYLGRLFFDIPVHDFHRGMRGLRRDRMVELGLRGMGMEYASEMVAAPGGVRIESVRRPLLGVGTTRVSGAASADR